MYKILVKSFLLEASEFPQSPLLREQLTPELELVPQSGSRSEVRKETPPSYSSKASRAPAPAHFLWQGPQSHQGSSSFPTAAKGEMWGLEEPPVSLPCPHSSGGFWVSHKPPEMPSEISLDFTGTTNVSDVTCPQIQLPRRFLKPHVSPLDAMGSKDTWLSKGKSACAGTRRLQKAK